MNTPIRSPRNCGESINLHGTFICKLGYAPCALQFDKKCELDKVDDFIEQLKPLWKDESNGEGE